MRVVDDRARYVEAVLVSDLLSGDGPHVEWADVWVGLDVVDAVGLALSEVRPENRQCPMGILTARLHRGSPARGPSLRLR